MEKILLANDPEYINNLVTKFGLKQFSQEDFIESLLVILSILKSDIAQRIDLQILLDRTF
jgi:hypothetical protein